MLNKQDIETILNKKRELHPNDPSIIETWRLLIEILSKNEEDTIKYLDHCSADDLYHISEVFEDVSEKLESREFIRCLRRLDIKYPELKMTRDIDIAAEWGGVSE
ncbi:MAG: hypothetical protein FWC69_02405 [Defluviitaleaceae bacterium]|nr:hypothetical protein [Defluviitaleaceae bacterium]